jgi:hypothetical protein
MPADKNQHYVPRFYLRNFAHGARKSIGLKNLRSELVVDRANIKNQCSDDYFYTDDGRNEKTFAEVEGIFDQLIKKILVQLEFPTRSSEDFVNFLAFVSFQRSRTAGAVAEYLNVANQVTREVLRAHFTAKGDQDMLAYVDRVSWNSEGLAMQLVKDALIAAPLIHDLSGVLVESGEKEKFITSDDPIIFTNLFNFGEKGEPDTGLSCRGLIIIFPISPDLAVILFDDSVYKINSAHLKRGASIILTNEDVVRLNMLQYKHASENIYFRDRNEVKATLVQSAARTQGSVRLSARLKTKQATTETGRSIEIWSQQASPKWPDKLSIFSLRKNAKRGLFKNENTKIRNPEFTNFVRSLLNDREKYRKVAEGR